MGGGRLLIDLRFGQWDDAARASRRARAARAGRRSVVEPHCSALEKVLVNPVIEGAGPAGSRGQWESATGADGQGPTAVLKGAGGGHAGRCLALRTAPCWREGGANMAAGAMCGAEGRSGLGSHSRGLRTPSTEQAVSACFGCLRLTWPTHLRETPSGGGQKELPRHLHHTQPRPLPRSRRCWSLLVTDPCPT